MEVIGAIASFIAIGQAIGATPKIIDTLRSFTRASKELAALITELDCLFMLYQHMKENIDLFSGGHNPSLLRVDEPPYLKHVRKDLESLMHELQDLADSCQRDGGYGSKVSKLRWWKKRESIARLRDECQKQRQQLQHLYMLFRDQIIHKQGEILVHIHARISQKDQVSPRDTSSLSSTNDAHITELPNSFENGAIVSQRDTVSLNSTTKAEVVVDRRCRCFCHTHKRSRQAQGLHMNLSRGWLSARLRAVRGNKCELNCCAATQTSVALQFCVPIWLRNLAVTGSFTFGLPFNLHMSLTPIIIYSGNRLQLERICWLGSPDIFHAWLSQHARSILNVDEDGDSVLHDLLRYGGYSLLAHCVTTWPGLIQDTEAGRIVARLGKRNLVRGFSGYFEHRKELSASDRIHLERFVKLVDDEDDGDEIVEIIQTENPIRRLNEALLNMPDILTRQNMDGETILHLACMVNDVELVKYVVSLGAPLDIADQDGDTPLHIAIYNHSWSSAEVLVENGCQVNVSNNSVHTPLLIAIRQINQTETRAIHFVKTLVSRGASLGAQDDDKRSVWHLFCPSQPQDENLWELYEILVDAGGADLIEVKDSSGKTPLMQAILDQNLSLVSFFQRVCARCDAVDDDGYNVLHYVSEWGDARCCWLLGEFEIRCLDIRTTDNNGWTPLKSLRYLVGHYGRDSKDRMGPRFHLTWWNTRQDNPGEPIVSNEKLNAFEKLLHGIRDRVLIMEIEELELIISKIQAQDLASARDDLRRLAEGKVKAKIDREAETFRAIELDIRQGRLGLAIESIEEFIEVSRDRMKLSPFDEEENPWAISESGFSESDEPSKHDERSVVEVETDDEDCAGLSSSEEGDERSNEDESRDAEVEDDEDEGWKTADED